MATSKAHRRPSQRKRHVLYATAALLLAACAALYLGCGPAPQLGASPEVFKTVDALFTAIGNRDAQRIGECEHRLHEANKAGTLPDDAWDQLATVIKDTRSSQWQNAAETLYDFMMDQRREVQ